jgi:hypothetical protein
MGKKEFKAKVSQNKTDENNILQGQSVSSVLVLCQVYRQWCPEWRRTISTGYIRRWANKAPATPWLTSNLSHVARVTGAATFSNHRLQPQGLQGYFPSCVREKLISRHKMSHLGERGVRERGFFSSFFLFTRPSSILSITGRDQTGHTVHAVYCMCP